MARALISLQQIPLRLTQDERLHPFIPITDRWREDIGDPLNRRHVWPIAIGSSVTWVTIAFVFTFINSFVSLDTSPDGGSENLAVGILWLWFLCLVIGWLWVPAFTCKPPERRVKAEGAPKDTKPVGQESELGVNPFPNPTHPQPTISFQSPTESRLDHAQIGVSENSTANSSFVSLPRSDTIRPIPSQSSIHLKTDRLLIDISNNLGALNRDERRLAATFNYSRVIRHSVLVDDVLRVLDKLTRENDQVGSSRKCLTPGVVSHMYS